jgi:hypothetical protein
MKSRKIVMRLLLAVLSAAAVLPMSGCEGDGPKVAHPEDNVSSLPWTHGQPGDAAQTYGGMPQSR